MYILFSSVCHTCIKTLGEQKYFLNLNANPVNLPAISSSPITATTCSYNYVAYLHAPAIINILGRLNYISYSNENPLKSIMLNYNIIPIVVNIMPAVHNFKPYNYVCIRY